MHSDLILQALQKEDVHRQDKANDGLSNALHMIRSRTYHRDLDTNLIDQVHLCSTFFQRCAYLILEMASINKHSNGKHVKISVRQVGNNLNILIHDNGIGSRQSSSSGQGIDDMKYRTQTINGKLTIDQSSMVLRSILMLLFNLNTILLVPGV